MRRLGRDASIMGVVGSIEMKFSYTAVRRVHSIGITAPALGVVHHHAAARPPDWMPPVAAVIIVFASMLVLLAWIRWDGPDEPGPDRGGGGGGVRPPEGPSPDGPPWWPEFERQFAEYVARTSAHSTTVGDRQLRQRMLAAGSNAGRPGDSSANGRVEVEAGVGSEGSCRR